MAKVSTTVNPFAAAAKKATSSVKKSTRPIYVADDVKGPNGTFMWRSTEVQEAISNYIEGHTALDQAKSMMDTNRPTVINWTTWHFCQDWLLGGKRPENPAITTKDTGDGDHMKVLFVDKAAKLDDFQFSQFANLVGQEKAEDNVIRRNEFTINPELLEQTAQVNENGKVVERPIMDAIIAALQEKFAPSPEILGSLFTAKEKFETKKGLLDKGLQLVTTGKTQADADRLVQFLAAIRCQNQLKPGAGEKD